MELKDSLEKQDERAENEEKLNHLTALTFVYRTIGMSVDVKDALLIEKFTDFVKDKTMTDIKLSDIDEIIKESNKDFEAIIAKSTLV